MDERPMLQVKIFTSQEDETLEEKINDWFYHHPGIEIVHIQFQAAAGGDFSYSSYCLTYRE